MDFPENRGAGSGDEVFIVTKEGKDRRPVAILPKGPTSYEMVDPSKGTREPVTEDVAQRYESIVRSAKLAELLTQGCGPDCGTHSADGPGCGAACGSCAVAATCSTSG